MRPASVLFLFTYNDWANQALYTAASRVDPATLKTSFDMGPGTLPATLAHIYGAERAWYERCRGPEHERFRHSSGMQDIGEIAAAAGDLAARRNEWLETMDDQALTRPVSYERDGNHYSHPLSEVLLHVCNHGVHHRAQASNMVRQLGGDAPKLDMLFMRIAQPDDDPMKTDLHLIHEYYGYTDWANREILALAADQVDEALDRRFDMGVGTLRKTLLHIRDAEQWWLENWRLGPEVHWEDTDPATKLPQLKVMFDELIAARNEFIDGLAEPDLDNKVSASPVKGKVWTFTLGESMLQLCGHGTHHRAQAMNMLRQLGQSVPALDLIARKRGQAPAAH